MVQGLVSVIITTYKREPDMVKRAIDSVINQTYRNTQIIVVDDSPHNYDLRKQVKELVLSYERIVYIENSSNKGAAVSRNIGIMESQGEYLAFLDDDDEWLPEKIRKQVELFRDDKVGLVYCREYIIDEKTKERRIGERNYHRGSVFKYLITDNFIGGNSFVLIKRQVIEKCGCFADIKSAQDAELFLRISREYEVDYVDEPLLNYYINHGERITSDHYNKIDGFSYINRKYWLYLLFHPEKKRKRLTKLLIPYKATDINKYVNTIIKIMLISPFRIRENYYYYLEIKSVIKKNKLEDV